MNVAADAILQALHYDPATQTLGIAADIGRLGDAGRVLSAALGSQHLTISDARPVDPPLPARAGEDALAYQGRARLFGGDRLVHLELVLYGGEVERLLLLASLEGEWHLAEAFPAVAEADGLGEVVMAGGLALVSYGMAGQALSGEPDRAEALARFDLQDGLQLRPERVIGADAVYALRERAGEIGLATPTLPDPGRETSVIDLHADVAGGWLELDLWWDESDPLPGLAEDHTHAAGLAVRYDLAQPGDSYHFWLRKIETAHAPIILEAYALPHMPIRYTLRPESRVPLGDGLAALLGGHNPLADLALELPAALTLIDLAYTPTKSLHIGLAAGDHDQPGDSLVQLGPLALNEVFVVLALALGDGPATPSVQLGGSVTVAGVRFSALAHLWSSLEGGLDEPGGVHVGQFLAEALPVELPFELDTVTLRTATLRRQISGGPAADGLTELRVKLDGKVELLPGALTLEEIAVDIYHPDGGSAYGALTAHLVLGPVALSVRAERHEMGGWLFDGVANAPPEGISLTKLVDHLAEALGAGVPDDVPDVLLKRVALSYDSTSSELELQAITDWVFDDDIPLLGGATTAAVLQLVVARQPDKGGREATFTVDLTLEKPLTGAAEPLTLEAGVLLSGATQSFDVDFDVPEGHQSFRSLARDVGLPDLMPDAAGGVVDALFQVKSLSLSYARPGNVFDIAWSRDLGQGVLLLDYGRHSAPAGDATTLAGKKATGGGQSLDVTWSGNDADSRLGLRDLLGLFDEAALVDDLAALPVVGQTVVDLLTFRQLGFTWRQEAAESDLTALAVSDFRDGTLAFLTVRRGPQRGVVAGIALGPVDDDATTGHDLDVLPDAIRSSIGDILEVVDEVVGSIHFTHLLISTARINDFNPPAYAASALVPTHERDGAAVETYPFGQGPHRLGEGVSLGVIVHFGEDNVVRRVLDFEKLDGHLTAGDQGLAVQLSIPGTLSVGSGDDSLTLRGAMLQLAENPGAGPEITVGGALDLHLFGQALAASARLVISEVELDGQVSITELTLLDHAAIIPLLPGVMLVVDADHPLSGEVGIVFETSGLEFGLQASFAVYKNESDMVNGDVGFVLEVVEEVPEPSYVKLEIDELSLPVLLEAVTGVQYRLKRVEEVAGLVDEDAAGDVAAVGRALGHLEDIFSQVELTDVRLYWADRPANLPDGSVAQPGVGVRGGLKIFDWNAFAMLDISPPSAGGITGHFEAEAIEIGGVFKLWGDGKGIKTPPKTAGDVNSAQSRRVDGAEGDKAGDDTREWYLEPGGPVLHFSTNSSPFVHADLHALLFEFLSADVHADVTTEGFQFLFRIAAGNDVWTELETHWFRKEGRFEAHGSMGVHLHGDIGPILPGIDATRFTLDIDLDAAVELSVDSESFHFSAHGTFQFEGHELSVPELVLTVKFASLADLVKALWDHIVDMAEDIFVDIIAPIGRMIADGAKAVAEVAEKAAVVVADTAVAAAKEAQAIVDDAGQAAVAAAGTLASTARALAAQEEELLAHASEKAVAAAATLVAGAERVAAQTRQIVDDTARAVARLAEEGAEMLNDALAYVSQVLADARQEVDRLLRAARAYAEQVWNAARHYAEQMMQWAEATVQRIMDDLEALGYEIVELPGQGFRAIGRGVSDGVDAVEKGAEVLGDAVLHPIDFVFG